MLSKNVDSWVPSYISAAEELRFNEGQWGMYQSKGHCVALAGPGSGKTKTLTIKLARLLTEEVRPPRGIACITYSNECVRELKRRLDALGVSQYRNLFIGTIHSFCLTNIIKPYGKLAGLCLPDPLMVAGIKTQNVLYRKASESIFPSGNGHRKLYMESIRRTILDRNSEDWRIKEEPVFKLIEAYEHELRSNGLIDFDDMVLLGHKLIENNAWVREVLKARFPILVVDEYQDLGVPLHRIVMNLCFDAGMRLIAVGDPDQSIYGFTGAKPELLLELSEREDVESVSLRMNYRCGVTIVRASEGLLGLSKGIINTPEYATEGTVDIYQFPEGIQQQAETICTDLIPATLRRQAGREIGDIAVLYLDKNDGNVIASATRDAGYDFIRIDQNAPYRRTPLTRWLEECAVWCSGGWELGEPRLSTLIHTWMIFNNQHDYSSSQAVILKRQLVRFLWMHRDSTLNLDYWLDQFSLNCLTHNFHRDCEAQDEYDALTELLGACSTGKPLENANIATFGGQYGSPNHLSLITLHSAKGREFQVVFMLGMDQGRIPWESDSEATKSEKRRLFYVGITRAMHEVHITYSGWYNYFGNKKELGPSEFIADLVERIR